MRINEIANPRPYIPKHVEPLEQVKNRLKELGIGEAYPYLMKWIYTGLFKASPETMENFSHVFYAIRNILPDEIIASYNQLPTLYRGMLLKNAAQLDKINNGGLDIKSQIGAWTPKKQSAISYAVPDSFSKNLGIVLVHRPTADEVVLALNTPTLKYLTIDPSLVANPDEVILSLPILKITPKIVGKVIK